MDCQHSYANGGHRHRRDRRGGMDWIRFDVIVEADGQNYSTAIDCIADALSAGIRSRHLRRNPLHQMNPYHGQNPELVEYVQAPYPETAKTEGRGNRSTLNEIDAGDVSYVEVLDSAGVDFDAVQRAAWNTF